MSAIFLNDNKIILFSGNILSLFQPPLYESLICQFHEGPYILATAFDGFVAAVSQNSNANPPLTQFFLLLYQEKSSNLIKSIEFPSKILGLRSNSNHLYVSMSKTIQVFDLKSFCSIATLNPASSNGYFAISNENIAWPDDVKPGRVYIATTTDFKVKYKIDCHSSGIKTMIFSNENDLEKNFLVTTSQKGTLVRLFDCLNGHLVSEFRRGYTQATIIDIDMKYDILCVCTSSTIHAFVKSDNLSHSSVLSSVISSFVPSFVKSNANSDGLATDEEQNVHLTVTPNGVPLACSVKNDKRILVVMNNDHLFEYEISDDYSSLSIKQAIPLKIMK